MLMPAASRRRYANNREPDIIHCELFRGRVIAAATVGWETARSAMCIVYILAEECREQGEMGS